VTPLYPQKFALTSPTSGGRLVGIVRSRTKATELVYGFVSETHRKLNAYIVHVTEPKYAFLRFFPYIEIKICEQVNLCCSFDQYAISVRLASCMPIEECRRARTYKNDPFQWKYLCIEGK
jgi:hypothetical protein